jgi:predicted nucleotidyltransferase
MGISSDAPSSGIAEALFGATQLKVLSLLLLQPGRHFSVSELIRLAGSGSGAVQREIERLKDAGLVTTESAEGRTKVQANRASPIFKELRSIIEKTTGVVTHLRSALSSSEDEVHLAILYGSVAKGTDKASSDIDVLLVAEDLTLERAFSLFEHSEKHLGRKINPTVLTPDEFLRRRKARHPFLEKVLSGRHVILMGNEGDLSVR